MFRLFPEARPSTDRPSFRRPLPAALSLHQIGAYRETSFNEFLSPSAALHIPGLNVTEIIAYHEAGHALMAYLLGGVVRQVTIEPDQDDGPRRGGDTQVVWRHAGESDKEFARKSVQVHLAGPVAEMIHSGEPYHPAFVAEWAADWEGAAQAAALLHPDQFKRLQYLEQTSRRVYQQFQADHLWMVLAALADALLAHETLDQEQVDELLQEFFD